MILSINVYFVREAIKKLKKSALQSDRVRGAITKKKRENLGKIPKGGEKTDENSQFQFGNFENPGGGLDFSKMSEL